MPVMLRVPLRTTLDIRDVVLKRVKALTAARSITNGSAATELIERGLNAEVPTKWENGVLVFDPGPSGFITLEQTPAIEDMIEDELG